MRRKYLLLSVVALALILAGCEVGPQPVLLVAYIEGRIPGGDWFHWDVLGTSNSTFYLEFRGTRSKERSAVEIVRFQWMFGDGGTAEGEFTSHTYYLGHWYITLIVYDKEGNSALETLEIDVH